MSQPSLPPIRPCHSRAPLVTARRCYRRRSRAPPTTALRPPVIRRARVIVITAAAAAAEHDDCLGGRRVASTSDVRDQRFPPPSVSWFFALRVRRDGHFARDGQLETRPGVPSADDGRSVVVASCVAPAAGSFVLNGRTMGKVENAAKRTSGTWSRERRATSLAAVFPRRNRIRLRPLPRHPLFGETPFRDKSLATFVSFFF